MTGKEEIRTLGIINKKIYTGSKTGTVRIYSINEDFELILEETYNTNIGQIKCFSPEFNIFGSDEGKIYLLNSKEERKLIKDYLACFTKFGKFLVTASWDKTIRIWDENYNEIMRHEDIQSWCIKSINIHLKYYDKEININCLLVCDYNGKFYVYYKNNLILSTKIHYTCIRSFDTPKTFNIDIKEFFDEKNLKANILKTVKTIKIVSVSNVGQILIHTLESIQAHVDIKTIAYKILCAENRICCLCAESTVVMFNDKLENKRILHSKNSIIWDGSFYNSNYVIIGGDTGFIEILDLKNNKFLSNTKDEEKEEEVIEYEHYTLKGNKIYTKTGEYIGEQIVKKDMKQYIDSPPERKQFSIEVGGTHLPISFMSDENPNLVANRFLMSHNLDLSYQNEIVQFINKHFKKHNKDFLGVELISSINIEAIKKKLENFDATIIFELLHRCIKQEGYEMYKDLDDENVIEYAFTVLKEIYDKMGKGEKYPIIDIIRYLALFEGINIDYLYFTDLYNGFINIKGDKEKIVLLRLVINLYPRKFLNMELFYSFLKGCNFTNSTYDKYLILRDKVLLEGG